MLSCILVILKCNLAIFIKGTVKQLKFLNVLVVLIIIKKIY